MDKRQLFQGVLGVGVVESSATAALTNGRRPCPSDPMGPRHGLRLRGWQDQYDDHLFASKWHCILTGCTGGMTSLLLLGRSCRDSC
jgi:hypothetical protein